MPIIKSAGVLHFGSELRLRSGQHRPRRRTADGTGCRAAGARDKCGGSHLRIQFGWRDRTWGQRRCAIAGEPSISIADLPQDLSPWGMFLHADIIVKAVMIGLAIALLVTWTLWLAKSIELFGARAAVRRGLRILVNTATLRKRMSSFAMRRDRSRT